MWLDMIHGTIERRVLLNYRLDPATVQRALPRPFSPKLYHGYGVGGVCMIRFSGLRPRFVPRLLGLGSENAAHRIAVEWEQDGEQREGVFIPRRDTNSRFNQMFGGRAFPGIFERSTFEAHEESSSVSAASCEAMAATKLPSLVTSRRVCRARAFSHRSPKPLASFRWVRRATRRRTLRGITTAWT